MSRVKGFGILTSLLDMTLLDEIDNSFSSTHKTDSSNSSASNFLQGLARVVLHGPLVLHLPLVTQCLQPLHDGWKSVLFGLLPPPLKY